ncbi:universal stress protein [Halalkalicoccus sp. NIPERK01]|uniref:universal stress protein n=1 Tax=Halalkalicoccus sp. NIPERK01 TaxID=3053469 RepID=UPI00256F3E89|nr:universal stress protein [Halalkalicoccus sp. NIPERK01]MDL5362105.1 universal stress protein [Halalkalicoccus sp. NIPERK01]
MKLLLGIGGSDDSWRALSRTAERAANAGDSLTVAILENPDSEMTPDEIESKVDKTLAEYDLEADVRHVEGDPGAMLVEIGDGEGYDQIVLGGGQRSPMGKIRVGQVAEFVVLNAETSVTLVR